MKTITATILLIVMVAFFAIPKQLYAQTAADTMYVPAMKPDGSPNFLSDVIMGDTTATGMRKDPNRVYVIQQTGAVDTTYFINNLIDFDYNLTVVGKTNPVTGHPPVIEPFINLDNSSPWTYFRGIKGTLKLDNIFFLATRTDSVSKTSRFIYTKGDSVTFIANRCVFDNFNNGNMINFAGSHGKLFVTNSEFRNIQSPYFRGGSAFWANSGVPVDTAIFANDTFFCVMRAMLGSPGEFGYLDFDHNTVFMTESSPFLIPQLTNAVIKNNIFFGLMAHGADSTQIKSNWYNGNQEGPSIITLDSLTSLANAPYNYTEAGRNVTVENNAYFWPQGLRNYWKAVSDTATDSGLITAPVWMNKQTKMMFTDTKTWPGITAALNDSVDPGFASPLVTSATDSLVKFTNLIWTNGSTGPYRWSQYPVDPLNVFKNVPSDWASKQGYPVPENLQYSNIALQTMGTDGKPLGDLNWYPKALTPIQKTYNPEPSQYTLNQNYPNPFNPTTNIQFSIPQATKVRLTVYNILGQKVATLINGKRLQAGVHVVQFNALHLASGMYIYRLRAGNFMASKKLMLIK